jgi:hypothetical protein
MDSNIDGILGLARADKKLKLNTSSTPDTGKTSLLSTFSLLEDDKLFSTRFSSDHFSWIDYGKINSAMVENITAMQNETVYDDFFWSMGMRGIKIGDNSTAWAPNKQAVIDKDGGLYTILDSGSANIHISDLYFESFLKMFFEMHKIEEYEAKDGKVTSKCSSFKPIYFLMGSTWLEIPPEDYYFKSGSNCEFRFKGIDAPFNILGMPAYRDYYVVHNFGENASMSWNANGRKIKDAPTVEEDWSTENVLAVNLATENVDDPEGTSFLIAGILAAAVLIGAVVVAVWGFSNDKFSAVIMALIIVGGIVGAGLTFFLMYVIVFAASTPGDNELEVKDADIAITNVSATHVGVFSLLAFAFYKLTGKKEEQAPRAATVEEADEVVSNYLM